MRATEQEPVCDLPPDVQVGEVFGKYLLVKELGRGSNGVVFQALHKSLHTPAALKFISPQALANGGDAIRERLRSEARILARLDHPNLARVWDFEDLVDHPHLVMEYVDGPTLAELIHYAGNVNAVPALDLISKLADALETAHKLGIVHRDVKPGNILLRRDGVPKLADLGQALKLAQSTAAPSGQGEGLAGTPAYMSPEQFNPDAHQDARTDIYGLGCTFYHAITGKLPFQGSLMHLITGHCHEPPPPPEQRVHGLPKPVSDVILRMMEKDPDDRYQTCKEVSEECRHLHESLNRANAVACPDPSRGSKSTLISLKLPRVGTGSHLQQGYAALQSGDRLAARQHFSAATEDAEERELAWLSLAKIAESDQERTTFLRRVLLINPHNQAAKAALGSLKGSADSEASQASE